MSSICRVLAVSFIVCSWSAVARAGAGPALSVDAAPTVTYRTFRDHEPTSADKSYSASGVLGAALRAQVFPFVPLALAPRPLESLGAYAHVAVSWLSSQDIDLPPDDPGHEVATRFFRGGAGLLYRLSLPTVVPLSLTFSAGAERWAFSFDMPSPPQQLTPTARYSFAQLGAGAHAQLGQVGVNADGHFMLPWSIDDLGDRPALTKGWGVEAGLGASLGLAPHIELFVDGRYTLFHFALPQILPRNTATAKVDDRYVGLSLGGRLTW